MNWLKKISVVVSALAMFLVCTGFDDAPARLVSSDPDDEDFDWEDDYTCEDVCADMYDECLERANQEWTQCRQNNAKWDGIDLGCACFYTGNYGGPVEGTATMECWTDLLICEENCAECGQILGC